MASGGLSLPLISKERSGGPSPGTGKTYTDAMYNRRREQVRRAQRYCYLLFHSSEATSKPKSLHRNHRDRQKMYIKSMEDEVVRLQKEWATVLEEIKRASDENLILKEILNCQPRSLSYSTSTPGVTQSRITSFGKSVEEAQGLRAATHDPDRHLRTITSTSKLSTPTSMPMPMLIPTLNARAAAPARPPSSIEPESFGFFTSPSTSDHNRSGYFQVQHESADEIDGTAFYQFTTMSHSSTAMLNKNPYMDLDLYVNPNDPIFPMEQHYLGTGHDALNPTGPQGYYGTDGMNPRGHGTSRTPPPDP
jgi:hypothetical protein